MSEDLKTRTIVTSGKAIKVRERWSESPEHLCTGKKKKRSRPGDIDIDIGYDK